MVKECKVIINNDHVTVADFGNGNYIQFPSIKKKADTIMVELFNGVYDIVDDYKPHNQNDKTVSNEFINDQSDNDDFKDFINSFNDKSNIVLIDENDIYENNQD
jgi:hypothetical protein